MVLPPNWKVFRRIVLNNMKLYCLTNIWPIEYRKFSAWLNNFDNEYDEYLALQIIDSLIVRSNNMAKVGYSRVLHSEVRQTLIDSSIISKNLQIDSWKSQLRKGGLNNSIRFTPIVTEKQSGESGNVIFRQLSPEINTDRYSWRDSGNEPDAIILVDDFIGSGNQFINNFADKFNLKTKLESQLIIYCPLIAYEEGINRIHREFPTLKLIPAEVIYKESGLFYGNETDKFKRDTINTIADVKEHFLNMKARISPEMPSWLGYQDVALPLTFEWGCPNQAPSILWMNDSPKIKEWHQLFSRRS